MIRDVHTLTRNATLNDALRIVLTGFQHDFPVLDGEQVVGVLTRATLLAGIAKSGVESSVGDAMETSFRTVSPEEQVNDALARLRECRCRTLPVVENGKLCGLLTTDNISEFVLIDAALHKPAREPRHRESRRVGSHPVNQVS
jgi:predicted transcriptional regulator